MVGIIGTIIFGAVVGVLARLALPGRQNISNVMTVVLGIIGALIGYWVWGGLLHKGNTSGIDVIRWLISIAAAALLVVAYGAITGKKEV